MDQTIYDIIQTENITSLYQPIVSLITGEVMGYEALSRGPEWSRLFSPVVLIEEAEKYGLTEELEFLFRKSAIKNMKELDQNQKLFININPNIMKKDQHQRGMTHELLEGSQISASNIVFELTERTMITDYEAFNDILKHYKEQNFKIAIDDVGAGYSGLRTIRETEPNFIKIDMELIRNIDKDSFKEALINAFLNFSITTNIKLIAEGIETEGELRKLIEMGVHYGQGYFLQRPNNKIHRLREEVIDMILNHNGVKQDHNIFNDAKNMIGTITNNNCIISASVTCNDVKRIIEETNCEGMCVVKDKKPLGIIMRDNLLLLLSSQYGLALYGKKPVAHVMDADVLIVDYHTTISEVSTKAMARERDKKYDLIVITNNGEYFGTISINTLLQNLISVETQIAKELNPLTLLPGNIIINRVLNDILLYQPKCGVIYLDFDHFKPYNDYYGFESGDQMIKSFAKMFLETVKKKMSYGSFVGHIGGDDFICVLETSYVQTMEICQEILDKFDGLVEQYYNEEDIERGYIVTKGRSGKVEKFKLLTLSIAGIYNNLKQFDSVAKLSRHMSELKKEAKSIHGNSIVIK